LDFDHPYPQGLMLVDGITEELPFGHHRGAVTVNGWTTAPNARMKLDSRIGIDGKGRSTL